MSQQRSCLRGTGKRSAHSHPKCSGGLHLWPPCVLEGNMAWIIPQQLLGSSIPQHKRLCTGKVAFWRAGIRLAGTTAPLPATGVGRAPCAGVGGLHQWGVQAHLWGFISYWVTHAEFWGPPNCSQPPTRLGTGSGQTGRQHCRAGLQDRSLQPFPRHSWCLPTVGGALHQPSTAGGECGAGTRSLLAAALQLCLGSFKGREKKHLPPSSGFCGAVFLQDPRWPPPGEVQPIFR